MEQAFDARDMKLSGEPVPIVDGPIEAFLDAGLFSISPRVLSSICQAECGERAYVVRRPREGSRESGRAGAYRGVSLSWDGTKAFLSRQNQVRLRACGCSMWHEARPHGLTSILQLTISPPLWAADGRNIIFGVEDQPTDG